MKTTDALNETVSGKNLKLKFGFYNYDRTRALSDGTVKIEGVDANFESANVITEIFERMIKKQISMSLNWE